MALPGGSSSVSADTVQSWQLSQLESLLPGSHCWPEASVPLQIDLSTVSFKPDVWLSQSKLPKRKGMYKC